MIKYKGRKYTTKRDLAKELGISYDAMLMRQSRGMSLRDAVDFKPKSSFTYKKKVYRSYAEFIKEMGLDLTVNQLKYRVKKMGSIAKAVKVPPHSYAIEYKGKKYRSLRALCAELGVVYSTIKNRINASGMALEDAIDSSVVAAKKSASKKTTARKAPVKRTAAKKPAAKKATAKKKPAAKKAAAKKPAAKKPAAKKLAAKKPAAKKAVAKKPAARKPAAKKVAPKKITTRKVVKKTTRRAAKK